MVAVRSKRLRLFLDATVVIKAVTFPRLPFEILRLGLRREIVVVLSPLVIESARFHIGERYPAYLPLFERVLHDLDYERAADPATDRVVANRDLCRDESDIPVALAAIDAKVDYLVTNDRDLTVVDSTTVRLRQRVKVITPLALLRHLLGWSEEQIAAAIHRNWRDLPEAELRELGVEPGEPG